jgi:hypothetical protein
VDLTKPAGGTPYSSKPTKTEIMTTIKMKLRYLNPIYWFFRFLGAIANIAEQAMEDGRK